MLAPSAPSPIFRSSLAGEFLLSDFDAIEQVSPEWEHRHAQVGRGQPQVRGVLAQTPGFQVACISRSPGARIQGASPRGAAVLAIALRGPLLQLQGKAWSRRSVGVHLNGGEFEVIAPAPHSQLTLAISQSRFDEAVAERWGGPFATGLSGPSLRLREPGAARAVLAIAARWLRAARTDPTLVTDPVRSACMEAEVLDAFLDGIDPGPVPCAPRPRRELARRAEAFLRDSLREPVRLQDLCDAVGASSRAVHAAFHDVFGIPPKAYLKALRLSAARSELSRARPGTTVSEVAARWGFFQFGYFSVDYRRMFGEQPRATLRRAVETRSSHVLRRPVAAGPR